MAGTNNLDVGKEALFAVHNFPVLARIMLLRIEVMCNDTTNHRMSHQIAVASLAGFVPNPSSHGRLEVFLWFKLALLLVEALSDFQ